MSAGPQCHAGELVMVDIDGTSLDADSARFLRDNQIRAVCLFRTNFAGEAQARRLVGELHDVLGPRALIATDQEGGSVVRATFLPHAPAAMALGAAGDAALAQSVGAAVARGLRAIGINWNFAPVLDLANNPANPVIGERSFGADPRVVARLAGAWLRGATGEGVACCVKHFPGHGDTHVDSHVDLPALDKSLDELEALELVPFRAVAAPATMTAHIVYRRLDPERPATLSRRVLGGVLRERLGFDGVVITDSLLMRAVRERWGHARAAVLALSAGADMALCQGPRRDQQAAIDAIGDALVNGALPLDAALRSKARLDALAARFPVAPGPYPDAQRAADEQLMRDAWARGLTALGDATPPALNKPLRVVTQRDVPSDGVHEAGPSAAALRPLFAGFADVEWIEVDALCALDAAVFARDGRFNVLVGNQPRRYSASAAAWNVDLHLALWNPFQVADVAAPAVVTWGYADAALDALRGWLEGRAGAPGRAPVSLAPRGHE